MFFESDKPPTKPGQPNIESTKALIKLEKQISLDVTLFKRNKFLIMKPLLIYLFERFIATVQLCYNLRSSSGRSADWLAHTLGVREVAGSNPVVPKLLPLGQKPFHLKFKQLRLRPELILSGMAFDRCSAGLLIL